MPVARQRAPEAKHLWPSGGVHVWPAGGVSRAQTHQRGHLVYAARGTLTVDTERGTSVVPANRVAWTPAATTHRHRAHGETDMRILFVPAPLAAQLPEHPTVLAVSDLAREALLTLTGPRSYDPAIRARCRKAQHRLLLVLLDELRVAPERPLELPRPVDPRLRSLAEMLDTEAGNSAPLTELGFRIGSSPRTLSRLLSTELGLTFHEWRTQIRIYRALVLLAEGHDVTHVALACGWANPSSFIVAFTRLVGTSPGRYRLSASAPIGTVRP
jgi:AraC-like DNA-binding protein